ncbi:hypothetical protein Tco_0071120 [Tanacetum coccineum]
MALLSIEARKVSTQNERKERSTLMEVVTARYEKSKALKKQKDDLLVKLDDTGFKASTYKRGLSILEGQILKYKESEVLFSEEIALLKRSVGHKEYQMGLLRTELEKVKEEKEGFEFKIAKFEKSSKDLDQLLASQITDKSKKGFGYNDVPSPHPLILNRPTPLDLSYSGLEEFKQPETDSSSVKSPLKVSNDEDDVEPILKVEKKTVIPTTTKKEFVKPEKPVRRSVSCPNVHKHMAPRAVLMKTGLKTVITARPINTVRSVNTGRSFSTARPFYKKTTLTKSSYDQNVNTGKQNGNTVRARGFNAVKPSACWVWKPIKPNGASLVVAESKTKDELIEPARTMLADSKFPTTFGRSSFYCLLWYRNGLNSPRPHKKKQVPSELFRGFKPDIVFQETFWMSCLYSQYLNNMGKFDEKSDEG